MKIQFITTVPGFQVVPMPDGNKIQGNGRKLQSSSTLKWINNGNNKGFRGATQS